MEVGAWGTPLAPRASAVITTLGLATAQTTPWMGIWVQAEPGVGLLLRGSPSHDWGLGEGGWGTDLGF